MIIEDVFVVYVYLSGKCVSLNNWQAKLWLSVRLSVSDKKIEEYMSVTVRKRCVCPSVSI
jgi:hypothetical protein